MLLWLLIIVILAGWVGWFWPWDWKGNRKRGL